VKGAIYYVAIATVIFSHVKITCYFHVWRYQVFARKLTWYFIGVYIINRWLLFRAMFVFFFLPLAIFWYSKVPGRLCGFGGVKCVFVFSLEIWSWFWATVKVDRAVLSYLVSHIMLGPPVVWLLNYRQKLKKQPVVLDKRQVFLESWNHDLLIQGPQASDFLANHNVQSNTYPRYVLPMLLT